MKTYLIKWPNKDHAIVCAGSLSDLVGCADVLGNIISEFGDDERSTDVMELKRGEVLDFPNRRVPRLADANDTVYFDLFHGFIIVLHS